MLSLFQIQVSEAKYTGVTQTLVKIGKDEGLYGYFKVWKLRISYDSLLGELGYWLNPNPGGGGGGGTLGIFGCGCAGGTVEPFAFTKASSVEFYYPILD